jgi:myotubularin-related protein 5/13
VFTLTLLQIHSQFPLAFEFNQYYIEFLAYHHVSNRFRTFMLDCEWDRVEAGWFYEENVQRLQQQRDAAAGAGGDVDTMSMMSTSFMSAILPSASSRPSPAGLSVWDYIERQHAVAPTFYNFTYLPTGDNALVCFDIHTF